VKHVNAHTLELQLQIKRYLGRPRALVVVSSDCMDRGYSPQLFENLGSADVPRVDDVPDSRERTDRLRAKQAVCVRDEPYRFQRPSVPRMLCRFSLPCTNQRPACEYKTDSRM
jgi:hypothetical protein